MCVRDIVREMYLVRTSSRGKLYGLSSFMKNASFSSGWLHLAVQCFFAVLIVASFILIVMMSIPFYSNQSVPNRPPRCQTKNCMVTCEHVPYFGKYKEDIVYSVSRVSDTCTEFNLQLRNPMFINETVLIGWLPRLRVPLHDLTIYGGNLQHLPSDAFLKQQAATIRTLSLYKLKLKTWNRDSLVGLSNLEELYIKECTIFETETHLLRPVHDTLKSLTVTESGEWDPTNFTGTMSLTQLEKVDFSYNVFHDILRRDSFHGLDNCKVLYLNSCNITAIGLGAFDNLRSIEILFLNNNYLVTVPEGLFNSILSITDVKPRINLQDNLWHCNCSVIEIRRLIMKDMLLTDPVCHSPEYYRGETFFVFQSLCDDDDIKSIQVLEPEVNTSMFVRADISGFVYINDGCNSQENSSNIKFQLLSPVYDHQCISSKILRNGISKISSTRKNDTMINQNSWIKFTFIVKTNASSMVQLTATDANDYGILWFQSSCPNEVYCVSTIPETLRVYNVDMNADYVFCPILSITGSVELDRCVSYNLAKIGYTDLEDTLQIMFYIFTGVICLVVGATCVYALVRKHPYLLKGSKRILFVKHKSVDALVLPPKVPLRNDLVEEVPPVFNEKKIFIVPTKSYRVGNFNRIKSTRSSKSNAPSYISALQPTDDQLEEWRTQNHCDNDPTPELASYSWICNADHYIDILDDDKTYESLK